MDFDDINYEKNYNAWSVYSQSKLANVLYSGYLQRQLKGSGVLVNVSPFTHCVCAFPEIRQP
jgi:retinol dehydrogenase-12